MFLSGSDCVTPHRQLDPRNGASMMTQQDTPRPGPVAAFARSAMATGRLLAAGRLASPRAYVGRRLGFADGTTSFVFRETAIRDHDPRDPAVLVVRFRLRAFGHRRLLHALFRRECILHTPLFAGFPGFQTKLWISDTTTGVYRGLYEWDGPERAADYADTLARLLDPLSTTARSATTSFQASGGRTCSTPPGSPSPASSKQPAPGGARRSRSRRHRPGRGEMTARPADPVDVLVVGPGGSASTAPRPSWAGSGPWSGVRTASSWSSTSPRAGGQLTAAPVR
jgi:hypothetical protein